MHSYICRNGYVFAAIYTRGLYPLGYGSGMHWQRLTLTRRLHYNGTIPQMLLYCTAPKEWPHYMDTVYLYYAGFAAGLFYLIGDVTGGFITPGYNYIRNAVSELVQSGAENRRLLSVFFFAHAIMIALFALGILLQYSFAQSWLVFVGGILLLAVGISHALSSSLFPMDPVGTESTFPGRMHLILVGVTVVCIIILMPLLGIGFSRLYGWSDFATYSFVSLAIIMLSGIASPIVIRRGIEVMGLTERITGYTFYLWMAVLAYLLISSPSS